MIKKGDDNLIELTFEQAKMITEFRWEQRAKGIRVESYIFREKFPELFKNASEYDYIDCNSGFCHKYRQDNDTRPPIDCTICPLQWKNPKMEKWSNYLDPDRYPDASGCRCCRAEWHWDHWRTRGNKERMKYWAKKVLAEVRACTDPEDKN